MHGRLMTHRRVAALAAALSLVGCGGGDDGQTATSPTQPAVTVDTVADSTTTAAPTTTEMPTTTTQPPTPGEEWQTLDTPFEPVDAVAVGDTLWIAGLVNEFPVLAASADGLTWTTHDLAALGLPTATTLSQPGDLVRLLSLGSWNGQLSAVVAAPPQPGLSADGVVGDLWVVTTEGAAEGGVRLTPPGESGLDQRLPGAENFRIMELGNAILGTERPTFTAVGQWWVPFKTGDADFAAIELGPDGRWSIFSTDLDDGSFEPAAGAAFGSGVVTLSATFASDVDLAGYTRTDAGWQASRVPLPPGIGEAEISGAASAADRVVAVGVVATDFTTGDFRTAAWTTVDGVTWSMVELPEGVSRSTATARVVWTGEVFLVAGNAGPLWSSPDGITWTIVGEHGTVELAMWNGRVVSAGNELEVSPTLG